MTFYICDRNKPCGLCNWNCNKDGCSHTSDPKHALNGICLKPEFDKRFIKTEFGDYWEVEQEEK